MRVLLAAAVSLAAAAVSAAGAAGPTRSILVLARAAARSRPSRRTARSSPGSRRAGKACNTVHVRSLDNGLHAELPKQGDAHNVTCRWAIGATPVSLAVAGQTSDVLWTLHESSPLEFDYLVGAGAGDDARTPLPGARAHESRRRPLVRRRRRQRSDARVRRHVGRLRGRGRLPRRHRLVRDEDRRAAASTASSAGSARS